MEVLIVSQNACLARHKSGLIVVSISTAQRSTNNNESDIRRKYIATIEKQPARYLRFDINQKTVKQPGHSMSREVPIVP